MLDLIPADLRQPTWYILAGFILGFAVSTLWEWLHFRRIRLQSIEATTLHAAAERGKSGVIADAQTLNQSPEFEPSARPGAYRSAAPIFQRERTQPRHPSMPDNFVAAESPVTATSNTFEEEAPDTTQPLSTSLMPHEATGEITRTPERTPSLPIVDSTQKLAPKDLGQDKRVEEMSLKEDRTVNVDVPTAVAPLLASSISEKRENQIDIASATQENHSEKTKSIETKTDKYERDKAGVDGVANEQGAPVQAEQVPVPREQDRKTSRVPRSRGYPDDLTKIRGIGDVYTRRLFAANIFTFHHVATSDVEVLRRATQAAPNANVESWPSQAEVLAQKSQRLNASYSGPLPDNLQQIPGIGPFFSQTLYRNGICTFEQLADASLEELRAILPPSILGREVDLAQLLNVAREKAAERQK